MDNFEVLINLKFEPSVKVNVVFDFVNVWSVCFNRINYVLVNFFTSTQQCNKYILFFPRNTIVITKYF